MTRRPRTLPQRMAWLLVGGAGWFPVRRQAPELTRPAARPERALTERRFADAVAAFTALRPHLGGRGDLFLKHPVFGDLTYDEFALFHVRHTNHHRKQIVERLAP
jgi:hypothetical protein